ncbi:hypothetical protein ACS0PU_001513 [Formica fusca]
MLVRIGATTIATSEGEKNPRCSEGVFNPCCAPGLPRKTAVPRMQPSSFRGSGIFYMNGTSLLPNFRVLLKIRADIGRSRCTFHMDVPESRVMHSRGRQRGTRRNIEGAKLVALSRTRWQFVCFCAGTKRTRQATLSDE